MTKQSNSRCFVYSIPGLCLTGYGIRGITVQDISVQGVDGEVQDGQFKAIPLY